MTQKSAVGHRVDPSYSDSAAAGTKQVCANPPRTVEELPEGTDLIGIITARVLIEESIIRRLADAVANGDKDEVFALAVELVAHQNE